MADLDTDSLASRFALPPAAAERLRRLAAELLSNPRTPIAHPTPRKIEGDHLADSLVATELDSVARARTIVDLGSGAGLPALPLAIALPGAHVTALEANAGKAAFIAEIVERCGVVNATAVTVRAEEWPEGLARFELVCARAVAPLTVVAEYAAPLLEIGGALVAWRGRRNRQEEADGAWAAGALGLALEEVRQVFPYPQATHRHLHVLRKVAPTPARFPRRPGVARKRPLRATR